MGRTDRKPQLTRITTNCPDTQDSRALSQMAPWSDVCPCPALSDRVTDSFRCLLSFEDECDSPEEKCRVRYSQRPCSDAADRDRRLAPGGDEHRGVNTWFCFAP